jgi:hypothetical protein
MESGTVLPSGELVVETLVVPADVELTDAQLAEALRGIAIQSRAFSQMGAAVQAYFGVKQRADATERKLLETTDRLQVIIAEMDRSKELQMDALRRYEQERRAKEAAEKVNFDNSKRELDEQLAGLALEVEKRNRDLASLDLAVTDKQQATAEQIEFQDQRLEGYRTKVDNEIAELDKKNAAAKEESDRINAGLAELRARIQASASSFITGTDPATVDKTGQEAQSPATLEGLPVKNPIAPAGEQSK